MKMMRISTVDTQKHRHVVVEGKLVGPWVTELKSACHRAQADLSGRELVVDLRWLMVISQEGENALAELMREGIRFHGRGVFAKYVLADIARRAGRNIQEMTA